MMNNNDESDFHYNNGSDVTSQQPSQQRRRKCCYPIGTLFLVFPVMVLMGCVTLTSLLHYNNNNNNNNDDNQFHGSSSSSISSSSSSFTTVWNIHRHNKNHGIQMSSTSTTTTQTDASTSSSATTANENTNPANHKKSTTHIHHTNAVPTSNNEIINTSDDHSIGDAATTITTATAVQYTFVPPWDAIHTSANGNQPQQQEEQIPNLHSIQMIFQYYTMHSVNALQWEYQQQQQQQPPSTSNRTYSLAFLPCTENNNDDDGASNDVHDDDENDSEIIHNFFNTLVWSIITNRTVIVQWYNPKTTSTTTTGSGSSGNGNRNNRRYHIHLRNDTERLYSCTNNPTTTTTKISSTFVSSLTSWMVQWKDVLRYHPDMMNSNIYFRSIPIDMNRQNYDLQYRNSNNNNQQEPSYPSILLFPQIQQFHIHTTTTAKKEPTLFMNQWYDHPLSYVNGIQYIKYLPEWNRHVAYELYYEGSDFLYGVLFRICFPYYSDFDNYDDKTVDDDIVRFALLSTNVDTDDDDDDETISDDNNHERIRNTRNNNKNNIDKEIKCLRKLLPMNDDPRKCQIVVLASNTMIIDRITDWITSSKRQCTIVLPHQQQRQQQQHQQYLPSINNNNSKNNKKVNDNNTGTNNNNNDDGGEDSTTLSDDVNHSDENDDENDTDNNDDDDDDDDTDNNNDDKEEDTDDGSERRKLKDSDSNKNHRNNNLSRRRHHHRRSNTKHQSNNNSSHHSRTKKNEQSTKMTTRIVPTLSDIAMASSIVRTGVIGQSDHPDFQFLVELIAYHQQMELLLLSSGGRIRMVSADDDDDDNKNKNTIHNGHDRKRHRRRLGNNAGERSTTSTTTATENIKSVDSIEPLVWCEL